MGQVSYYTTGTFSGSACSVSSAGNNDVVCTAGSDSVEFISATQSGSDYLWLGSLNVISGGQGSVNFSGESFDLSIYQTSPTPTSGNPGTFIGSLAGTLTGSTSSLSWDPSITTVTIVSGSQSSTYTLTADPLVLPVGDTDIAADLTQSPEPSSLALLGCGLLGLARFARRFVK